MLQIENLTRRFMKKCAVDDVSCTLETGKIYALLGPNGAGKTTLMKMVSGLMLPTSGRILYEGKPVSWKSRADIAYMPTENYFYPYMTVANAGKYYADFFADFDAKAFAQYLERMELSPKDKVKTLSSGMAAKLRIALVLSRRAGLMLFDEPLNGVDILTRTEVIAEIARARDAGRTMVISSHLADEMEGLIDGMLFIDHGKLVRTATEDDGNIVDLYLQVFGGKNAQVNEI